MKSLNAQDITIARLMPLMGHIMCFVRQQTSQSYAALGYDITPEAADALMIIQHFSGLPQTRLAHIMGKDKAAITRLLNSLVKAGLVERVQDQEDRRIIRAHVTQEGSAVFQKILPKLSALNDLALQGIDKQDFNQAINTLQQIVKNTTTACCKHQEGK